MSLTKTQTINVLAAHFQEFTQIKSSPIYAALGEFIATQPDILQAISSIPMHKSPRTILFAAVHALLLKGILHPLAEFYPSLNGKKPLNTETCPILCREFLDFFQRNQTALEPYFLKSTQTNEARRSLALLPALSAIVTNEQQTPLSLIEIGSSAGFLLNLDRYGYQINETRLGNKTAELFFSATWQGDLPENLIDNFVTIRDKIGIDINPLDIEDDEVRLWLRALIWPEQVDRLHSFDIACKLIKQYKAQQMMLKGTFENNITKILETCATSPILCFVSVWMLYQLSVSEQNSINESIRSIAKSTQKKVYYILDDWNFTKKIEANNIILREFNSKGNYHDRKVCQTDHHGQWINSYL